MSRLSKCVLLVAVLLGFATSKLIAQTDAIKFRAMTWNLKQSRAEGDRKLDLEQLAKRIREQKVDVLAVQSCRGVAKELARKLGYQVQVGDKDLALISRFPIEKDISTFEETKCVGSILRLGEDQLLAFYSVWIPGNLLVTQQDLKKHQAEINQEDIRSATDLEKIVQGIRGRLGESRYKDAPIVVAGEFNSMSHLDYSEVNVDQFGTSYEWKSSKVLSDDGFADVYRWMNPVVDRNADATHLASQNDTRDNRSDRTSYVYCRGSLLQPLDASVPQIDQKKLDHAGLPDCRPVLSTFEYGKPRPKTSYRVVSYNIKHGHGMDGKVDLQRTGRVLEKLKPDFVGLQEVDWLARRSGNVNQPKMLSKQLGMHAAFGKFMDYQGGKYGMGILSRYPIVRVEPLRLPEGNEPRIALIATVQLPDQTNIKVVNVHFDWVRDDKFRLAQAKVLANYLANCDRPYILMGDFNDVRESATLKLFAENTVEAIKPSENRFTIPSDGPRREIDFIFASPKNRWQASETRVVDEKVASDHCPVVTTLKWKPAGK